MPFTNIGETCGKCLVYLTYYSLIVPCSCGVVWYLVVHLAVSTLFSTDSRLGRGAGNLPRTQACFREVREWRHTVQYVHITTSLCYRHKWKLRSCSLEEVQSGTNVFVGFVSKSKSGATDGKSQCVNYEIQ